MDVCPHLSERCCSVVHNVVYTAYSKKNVPSCMNEDAGRHRNMCQAGNNNNELSESALVFANKNWQGEYNNLLTYVDFVPGH